MYICIYTYIEGERYCYIIMLYHIIRRAVRARPPGAAPRRVEGNRGHAQLRERGGASSIFVMYMCVYVCAYTYIYIYIYIL